MILIDDLWSDNPWTYADQKKTRKDTKEPTRGIGACHHYNMIPTPDLCALGSWIKPLLAERAMLHLWFTSPLLPDALQVLDAWGFEFCTVEYVWVKLNKARGRHPLPKLLRQFTRSPSLLSFLHWLTKPGTGTYTMSNVEGVLLGRRGKPAFHPASKHKARQVQYWPLLNHSRKPMLFQDLDEWSYPQMTVRCELFARARRSGVNPLTQTARLPWISLGNESPITYGEDIAQSLMWLSTVQNLTDYTDQQHARVMRNLPIMKRDAIAQERAPWWMPKE